MNKEYSVCTEDKIIVSTDKGMVVRENSDNIDEILKTENLLEIINKKIKELIKEIEEVKEDIIVYKKHIKDGPILAVGVFIVLHEIIIKHIDKAATIDTRFGPMNVHNFALYFYGILLGLYGTASVINYIRKYKKSSRREKEIINELEYFEKTYEIEKTKLEELENEKTNSTDDLEKYEIKKLNTKEALEKMREELIAYCSEKENKEQNVKTIGQKRK